MTPPPAPPAASAATFALEEFVTVLGGVLAREISGLEAIAREQARGRPHGRDAGLGYAQDEYTLSVAALTELRAFLADLVPHEPTVRALIPARAA